MKTVIIQTANGMALRFESDEIRATGRVTQGVSAIKLNGNDNVVGVIIVDPSTSIMTVTENGHTKITPVDQYPITHRGGKGVISCKITEQTGDVVSICEITDMQNSLDKAGI